MPRPGCCLRPGWSCSKAAAGKMNLYESFAQATQLGDLHTCLMMDMKACQEDDVRLLCHLTPSIYTEVRALPAWGGSAGCVRRSAHSQPSRTPPHGLPTPQLSRLHLSLLKGNDV